MTIDKSTRILVDRYIDTYVVCGGANYNPAINITRDDYEAFQVAIDTMHKYQKIKEIVTNKELEWGNTSVRANALLEVKKVVEDGDDTTNTGSN